MIIYKIQNKVNGKCYIGQTIHPTFNLRYSGGRWWDVTDNPLLINAAKKYGKDNFEIEILVKNVENLNKLNELEEFYAEKFNSYAPNGYNLRKCGDNKRLLPHQIEMIRKRASKTFLLRKVDTWEIIEIFNLKDFARKNNLTVSALYNMIRGHDNVIVSQGYCLATKTKDDVMNRKMRKFKNKIWQVVNKNGDVIKISNLKQFIKDNNLDRVTLYQFLNGKLLSYKGFKLLDRLHEVPNNIKEFVLLSPTKEIVEGINIKKFCEDYYLSYTEIRKVLRKERLDYKGWRLPETTDDDLLFKRHRNKISITLISPEGKEVFIENLYLFCVKNNLNYDLFYNLYKDYNKSALGWIKKENATELETLLLNPSGEIIRIFQIKEFCKKQGFNYNSFINMLSGNAKSYKGWKLLNPKLRL